MENETDRLDNTIMVLEEKRTRELELLKEHLDVTYESLKPVSFIKRAFKEVSSSPDMKNHVFGNVIGLGTGFLFKKLWVGKSHNPIKILIGTVAQFAVANVVSKYADNIKCLGKGLLYHYFKNREESKKAYLKNV